ncbi:MAG: DUF4388 domain-containing protein [Acidimicrobiales bacterium]
MEFDHDQAPAGSLDTTPLPELLATLAEASATGIVRIDGDRRIWLADGRIYLARTPGSPELVAVLYGGDLGSADDIVMALESAGSDGGGALDRLLDAAPGAEGRARRMLREHNLSALFEMLVPCDAGYRFEDGTRHPIGARFADDVAELVAEAAQRIDVWRRIAARIPSIQAVFTWAADLPAESSERLVSADEWRFLSHLDGRSSVATVINQTGESAFRVCSVLYRLLLEGLIVEAAPATVSD